MIQNKEMASVGFVKVLDINKRECFVSPEQLMIGGETIIKRFNDLEKKYNKVIESNIHLQKSNEDLKQENKEIKELLQKLQTNVEDVTTFSMES